MKRVLSKFVLLGLIILFISCAAVEKQYIPIYSFNTDRLINITVCMGENYLETPTPERKLWLMDAINFDSFDSVVQRQYLNSKGFKYFVEGWDDLVKRADPECRELISNE